MTAAAELKNDKDFVARWPYVYHKLKPFFAERQREFALARAGQHEEIGRYVDFMANLFADLEQLDAVVNTDHQRPTRPRLNNSVLSNTPPPRKPQSHGQNSSTTRPSATAGKSIPQPGPVASSGA